MDNKTKEESGPRLYGVHARNLSNEVEADKSKAGNKFCG